MKILKPFNHHAAAGKTPGGRRDPMRWIVAVLVMLALFGIGVMGTHVLILREGKDLLPAILEATAFVLIVAIPIGYVVYRFWFAERIFMKPIKGFSAGAGNDDRFHFVRDDSLGFCGYRTGPSGFGLYHGDIRIDDDDD